MGWAQQGLSDEELFAARDRARRSVSIYALTSEKPNATPGTFAVKTMESESTP